MNKPAFWLFYNHVVDVPTSKGVHNDRVLGLKGEQMKWDMSLVIQSCTVNNSWQMSKAMKHIGLIATFRANSFRSIEKHSNETVAFGWRDRAIEES